MAKIKSWVASGIDGNGRIVHKRVKLFEDGPDRYSPVYGYIIGNIPYDNYEEALAATIRISGYELTAEEAGRSLKRMMLEYVELKKQAEIEAKGGVLGE